MRSTQNVNVMRVSAVFLAAARCCNTANSSATIVGKFEIMNKRIGSMRNRKFPTFNPALHLHKPLLAANLTQPKLEYKHL